MSFTFPPMSHRGGKIHTIAKEFVPPDQAVKATTIWAAVLKPGRLDDLNGLSTEDFLWFKCKGSTTVGKICQIATGRLSSGDDIVLTFSESPPSPETTMAQLDAFGDGIIVMETEKRAAASPPAYARQPLQSSNARPVQSKVPAPPIDKANVAVKPENPSKVQDSAKGSFRGSQIFRKGAVESKTQTSSHQASHPTTQPTYLPKNTSSAPKATLSQDIQAKLSGTSTLPAGALSTHQNPNPQHLWSAAQLISTLNLQELHQCFLTDGFRMFVGLWYDFQRNNAQGASHHQLVQILWNAWWQQYTQDVRTQLDSEATSYFSKLNSGPEAVSSIAATDSRMQEQDNDEAAIDTLDGVNEASQENSFRLQNLLKDVKPETLEKTVEEGLVLLDRLKAPLEEKMGENEDAERWIQQIDTLQNQAVKTRTIIGVVGNTGAGKSSVINAMLEEERLVPTNCMRACTAVVTEISYNFENQPYRAEIEFISAADWEKELKTLFQDLFDGEGRISKDYTNEDTDAGIAFAKIKAVYPSYTRDELGKSDVKTLLRKVSGVLGTTKSFHDTDCTVFYKNLQKYIDSKEKSAGKKDAENKKKEPKVMEYWPLIRVVRIYVKSPALATGAVIVDLPGVHDANAARAAVAEGYMKQCTGLWIVAPINRAVDDKAAKSLLGESFKRQLKMDGGFNSVTFICSKTDDISLGEASDSLGIEEEMGSSWEEMDRMVKKQRELEKEVKEMQDNKNVYAEIMSDMDDQVDEWEELKEKLSEGKEVFAPQKGSGSKKRKSPSDDKRGKKKRRKGEDDDDFIDDDESEKSDSEDNDDDQSSDETEEKQPLTEEQINAKLAEFKANKKGAKESKQEILGKIKEIKKQIKEAKEVEDKIHSELSARCISGRNEYSKGAIQQDFAAGIKELDQEIAAEDDEDNFNPDIDARDYEEVARSLPVFCVSSRGYHKLKGRLKKDAPVCGFSSVEETEIPQLQAHCEKLTETGRSASCQAFMTKLSQLLNSLALWASNDGSGANLTKEQRAKEDKQLQKGLKTLETELENAVEFFCKGFSAELADNVFEKYDTAIPNASEEAVETARHWGDKVNRDDRAAGGYFWATYKAICRRYGVYSNAQGPHDWNAKLTEPMIKVLAPGWEKTFSRRLPMVIANFVQTTSASLKKFHKNIDARARKLGIGLARLHVLSEQLSVYETSIKNISSAAKDEINTAQKDINREFTPVIGIAMTQAYDDCANERGPGSFARMKVSMGEHIEAERHTMFETSGQTIQKLLEDTIRDVKAEMDERIDEVYLQLCRDYRSVLGGGDQPDQGQMLPKAQRLARKQIIRVIDTVETRFTRVIEGRIDEDEMQDEPQDEDEEDGGKVKKEESGETSAGAAIKQGRKPRASAQLDDESASINVSDNKNVDSKPKRMKQEEATTSDALNDSHQPSETSVHGDSVPPTSAAASDEEGEGEEEDGDEEGGEGVEDEEEDDEVALSELSDSE